MKWTNRGWSVSTSRVGVFTVTVQPEESEWKLDMNGIVSKARWPTAGEAHSAAPAIVKAWLAKAIDALTTESQ